MATKNFDITKISNKQKRELANTGSFTDRFNRQRTSDGGVVGGEAVKPVVTQNNEVDIAAVPENIEPVNLPETNLKDLSIAFSGKADETTMAEIGERDPELVSIARQFQNTGEVVEPEEPVEEESVTDGLQNEAQTLAEEIRTLEEKMANSDQRRSDAYEAGGIFDDMRTLNQLKDRQRQLQDEEIEIGIEGKQALRGRTATKRDFQNYTMEATEKNVLNQLANSRSLARFSDSIETNLAVIDSKLQAEVARDEFFYGKKIDRLNTVEKAYADIITEQQKEAIEFQKFQYDLLRDSSKADADLRNTLITEFVKGGGAKGMSMNDLLNMSSDDLIALQSETTSPFNWTNLSPEEAALYLDEDTYDRYTTYTEQKNTMTAEEEEAFKIKSTNLQTANSTIDLIEEMLDDKAGLQTSVGEGAFGRMDFSIPGFAFGKESNKFRANFKKLVSQKTLDKLLELKAAGGTLGAISEKELDILGKAAIALGSVENGEGKASGKSNLSEEEFRTAMKTLRVASMKTYIAERVGATKYAETGFYDYDAENEEQYEEIEQAYQELKKTPMKKPTDYSTQELRDPNQNSDGMTTALNMIREEEGLRTEAYQDQTGTWTIGFGTTTINGRPVQPGDRLTEPQAEAIMRNQVVEKYTTFADNIQNEVTPNQFAALTSFEYNLGSGVWQQPTGQRILALINEGRNDEAGRLMLQYHKSRNPQTGELEYNQVLAQRRMREANLLLS